MRLIDMGCDAFLVASSLRAVIAQRLVRRICEHCKQPYKLNHQELAWLGNIDGTAMDASFVKGSGCHQCNNTGYSGRIGVYELLEMDEHLLFALRKSDAAEFARAAASSPRFRSLAKCALDYAREGITTIQEVFKISASLDDTNAAVM
jgi:MSHA biogenesis protein MshE